MIFPCTVYNRVAADFDANYPRQVASQEDFEKLGPGWFDDPVAAAEWEPPKLTGPTFEDWTKAGYNPAAYPPQGYAEIASAGLTEYRANLEAARIAADEARKANDAAEVAALEKAAALTVLDGRILAAMEKNDAEEVTRLEAEKAAL